MQDRVVIESFADSAALREVAGFVEGNRDANGLVIAALAPTNDATGPWLAATEKPGEDCVVLVGRKLHGWCLSTGPAGAAEALARYLFGATQSTFALHGPAETADPFIALWNALSGKQLTPAFRFGVLALAPGELLPPPIASGMFAIAMPADLDKLAENSVLFYRDSLNEQKTQQSQVERMGPLVAQGRVCVWRNGDRIVSQVEFALKGDADAGVSYLYTPSEARGRGYAKSLIAGLAQHLGLRRLTLFGDQDKTHVVKLYRDLGFRRTCLVHRYDHL